MININLIPESVKKETSLKSIYRLLEKLLGSLAVLTVSCAIVFLFSRIAIRESFSGIAEQATAMNKTANSYIDQIKKINSKTSSLENIQNEFMRFSVMIKKISESASAGIGFKEINISAENKMIYLSGISGSRENLLALKNNLNNLEFVEQTELPFESLLKEGRSDFRINVRIK